VEMLQKVAPGGGRLYGLDQDPLELPKTTARIREAGYGEEAFFPVHTNYAAVGEVLLQEPEGVDFILADLGLSSMQIDNPERGFTFKSDGPLDLRMDPSKGEPASACLEAWCSDLEFLETLFVEGADFSDYDARLLAGAVAEDPARAATTKGFDSIVRTCAPPVLEPEP